MGMGDENCLIQINGGYTVLDAQGDGVDSNGSVEITGGVLLVCGPTSNGDGAFDYDLTATVTGGTVLMVGSNGMAQNFTSGEQPFAFAAVSGSAGQNVAVVDSDGTVVASFTAAKQFGMVLATSPAFVEGGDVFAGHRRHRDRRERVSTSPSLHDDSLGTVISRAAPPPRSPRRATASSAAPWASGLGCRRRRCRRCGRCPPRPEGGDVQRGMRGGAGSSRFGGGAAAALASIRSQRRPRRSVRRRSPFLARGRRSASSILARSLSRSPRSRGMAVVLRDFAAMVLASKAVNRKHHRDRRVSKTPGRRKRLRGPISRSNRFCPTRKFVPRFSAGRTVGGREPIAFVVFAGV